MKSGGNGLKVIHSNSGQEADQSRKLRGWIIAAVIGLGVLLVGGAQWSHRNASSSQQTAAQPAAAQAEPAAIDYFPAQYLNQATEKEEHIQAF